jgi:hypothetical protein
LRQARRSRSSPRLDKDNDRFLTRAEAMPIPGLAAGFDLADRNADGYLNRPEFDAATALSAYEPRRAHRKPQPEHPRGGAHDE